MLKVVVQRRDVFTLAPPWLGKRGEAVTPWVTKNLCKRGGSSPAFRSLRRDRRKNCPLWNQRWHWRKNTTDR